MDDKRDEIDRDRIDIADLVSLHHGSVYRYAFRLTGSAVDAEDLTQESFLIAQQKLDQLRDAHAARVWLTTILRNCFIRSRRRPRPLSAGSIELDIDNLPDETATGDAIDGGAIDGERLQKALNRLSAQHRLIVAMFYFEDIPYREIAEQLELPIGTVMSRLARAKGRLRNELFDLDEKNRDRKERDQKDNSRRLTAKKT